MNHELDGRGLEAARDENELLPCPLCDTAVVARWSAIPRRFAGQIHCDGCGLEMTRYGTDLDERQVRLTLVAAWNRRPPALPAIGEVAVRKLEWQKENIDGTVWTGVAPNSGQYLVKHSGEAWEAIKGILLISSHASCDEAKAAAQQDFETRICSSLVDHGQHPSQVVYGWNYDIDHMPVAVTLLFKAHDPDEPEGSVSVGISSEAPQRLIAWSYLPGSTPLTETAKAEHVGAEVVPDVCVLVPREPTKAMRAAFDTGYATSGYRWADGYRAMLAAAPQPSSVGGEREAQLGKALLWAMDEIDVLSNKLSGFAYPQGMAQAERPDQLDSYRLAVDARRAFSKSARADNA